jgi:hypothetical protein
MYPVNSKRRRPPYKNIIASLTVYPACTAFTSKGNDPGARGYRKKPEKHYLQKPRFPGTKNRRSPLVWLSTAFHLCIRKAQKN